MASFLGWLRGDRYPTDETTGPRIRNISLNDTTGLSFPNKNTNETTGPWVIGSSADKTTGHLRIQRPPDTPIPSSEEETPRLPISFIGGDGGDGYQDLKESLAEGLGTPKLNSLAGKSSPSTRRNSLSGNPLSKSSLSSRLLGHKQFPPAVTGRTRKHRSKKQTKKSTKKHTRKEKKRQQKKTRRHRRRQ